MPRVCNLRRFFRAGGLFTLVVGACAAALPAHAQLPADFQLCFGATARLLDAYLTPDYYDVLYDESCDNPNLRVRARNKPAIRLDNTSGGSEIVTFTLQINQPQFIFDNGDFDTDAFTGFIRDSIYTSPGVTLTDVTVDNQELVVNFTGLTPGRRAIFNVDLDTTDPAAFPFPDFRNVLFGAPMEPGDSPSAAATFGVTFGPPASLTVPGTLMNAVDTKGVNVTTTNFRFQNENLRPKGEPDKMEIICIPGVIPEPSSVVLAIGMGVALVAAGVRSRKAA